MNVKRISQPLVAIFALAFLLFPSELFAQDEKIWVDSPRRPSAEMTLQTTSVARLADEIRPAVVNVLVSYQGDLESFVPGSWGLPDGRFAQGSGFIIHPSGYFLTNHHVVEGAQAIKVRLFDSRELEAEIVGVDPQTDIALLRIRSPERFPSVQLGDSDDVRVGEYVLAIGNPLGLSHTVTSGIVSALGRRNLSPDGRDIVADFIQTDASINPGNSGGPLISLHGEVIGINTAINRAGQGIGFAIPINVVKTLLPQLKERGYIIRTRLGIRIQEVTPALARSFGMNQAEGALITEIIDNTPASKSELVAGDVIIRFHNHRVRSSDQLPWFASMAGASVPVEVVVFREGKEQSFRIQLDEIPNQRPPRTLRSRANSSQPQRGTELGITVENLSEAASQRLDQTLAGGVVVTELVDASPARKSGLRRRDVIVEVGSRAVLSDKEFHAALAGVSSGEVIRLKVIRQGRVIYLAFER